MQYSVNATRDGLGGQRLIDVLDVRWEITERSNAIDLPHEIRRGRVPRVTYGPLNTRPSPCFANVSFKVNPARLSRLIGPTVRANLAHCLF